jgi:uncharacterized protein with PQ loop repeat
MTWQDTSSSFFGFLSVVFWVLVYCPQAIKVHRSKNVDGVSPVWLLLWFFGDSCNLVGTVLTSGLPIQLVLGGYYVIMDLILLTQWVVYHSEVHSANGFAPLTAPLYPKTSSSCSFVCNERWRLALCFLLATLGLAFVNPFQFKYIQKSEITFRWGGTGNVLGWASAVFYISSRFPQIYQNYHNKRTGELTKVLFLLTIFGNATFAVSLCCYSLEPEYLLRQLPWLVGSTLTLVFDGIILVQIHSYHSFSERHRTKPFPELSDSDSCIV